MKKFRLTLLLSLILGAAISLSSCNKNGEATEEIPKAEYTIMFYGCGGGNLDESMLKNIKQALLVGSNDKVKMTAQIKFSAKYQDNPDLKGMLRFVVNKDERSNLTTLDAATPMYDPGVLADFINWSKETNPAKNYILVLWNHGNGWTPGADGTKGVIFDDNVDGLSMSLNELVAGIKKSNTKMKMIYYDACSMATLENYCGLVGSADYALGAAHVTPEIGGDYSSLIDNLTEQPNFELAIKQYCRETMAHWNPHGKNLDIALTDLSKLSAVTDALNSISGELVATYGSNQKLYDEATCSVYRLYKTDYLFDVIDYSQLLATTTFNPNLTNYASKLLRARDAAIVCSEKSSSLQFREISWSVTIVNDKLWDKIGYENIYQETAFDKATGWSNWLKLNTKEPVGNPTSSYDEEHEEHEE